VVIATLVVGALLANACSDDGAPGAAGVSTTVVTTQVDVSVETGASGWTQFGHDLANSRWSPDEVTITPETAAELTQAWAVEGIVGVTSSPTVVDGVAYFGDWTGAVHALDVATGDRVWRVELGGSVIGSVPVDGGALFASTGVTLYRLDRATGEVVWEATVDDHPFAMISASPVVADGVVLQGVASGEVTFPQDDYTFTGSISAFDAETGDRRWRFDTTPGDDTAGAGVGIWSTPAVDLERDVLYVGTGNTYEAPSAPLADSLLALDLETGELVWSTAFTHPDVWSAGNPRDEDADVGTAPNLWSVDDHDLVGAGDKNGVYHALDRDTGEVVWESSLTPGSTFGGINGSSAIVDGALIVTSNIGDPETNASTNVTTVSALDAATGAQRWQIEEEGMVFAPVSAAPGVAFVGTTLGAMLALDVTDGTELWRHEAPNSVGAGPTVTDGHLLWGYGYALFSGPGEGGLVTFTPGIPPPPPTSTSSPPP
jgi:polyvinyl alcohol dehydrogenase (cytochrome)